MAAINVGEDLPEPIQQFSGALKGDGIQRIISSISILTTLVAPPASRIIHLGCTSWDIAVCSAGFFLVVVIWMHYFCCSQTVNPTGWIVKGIFALGGAALLYTPILLIYLDGVRWYYVLYIIFVSFVPLNLLLSETKIEVLYYEFFVLLQPYISLLFVDVLAPEARPSSALKVFAGIFSGLLFFSFFSTALSIRTVYNSAPPLIKLAVSFTLFGHFPYAIGVSVWLGCSTGWWWEPVPLPIAVTILTSMVAVGMLAALFTSEEYWTVVGDVVELIVLRDEAEHSAALLPKANDA